MNWEAALYLFLGGWLLAFAWGRISHCFVRVPATKSFFMYRDEKFSRVLMPGFHFKPRLEKVRHSMDLTEQSCGPFHVPTVFLPELGRIMADARYRITDPLKVLMLPPEKFDALVGLVAGNSVTTDETNGLFETGTATVTPIPNDSQTAALQNGFEVLEVRLFVEKG